MQRQSLGRIGEQYWYIYKKDGTIRMLGHDFQAPITQLRISAVNNQEQLALFKKAGHTVYLNRGSNPEYFPAEYWIMRITGPFEEDRMISHFKATIVDIAIPGRSRKALAEFQEKYNQMVLDNSPVV